MNASDLAEGVMPRSLHHRVERRQVAEYVELGHRVCFALHGGQHDNAATAEARRRAVFARCWAAGLTVDTG